jgi:flagellar hook protein FlgE
MRLESALRTSREGITAHGQAIAVVSDNISNVSTTAFKQQRAEFKDMLSDKVGDRGSEVIAGGGDGVFIDRVRLNFETGALNATGRQLDIALSGNGFFVVGDVAAPKLTRTGNFEINGDGILTTSDGLPVLGYSGTDIAQLGTIQMNRLAIQTLPTGTMEIFGNLDAGAPLTQPPANPATFQELNSAAAFVSTHSVFDTTGARHDFQLYYFKTGANQWTAQAYINGSEVGQADDIPVALGQTTITFNQFGQIDPATQAQTSIAMNPTWANGAAQNPITIGLGLFTQFGGGSRVTSSTQDGRGNGDVVAYDIAKDGKIFATLNTGDRVQAGTLALGMVTNLDGLERQGGSLFAATQESGAITVGLAGAGGRGGTVGGALESSNVDLSSEFVNMIVYQRGYQASSQVLSTTSDMIKNTIALIR